jgi:hypothetical protein
MKHTLAKDGNQRNAGRTIWLSILMCVSFAFIVAISLVLLALLAHYKQKYGELNTATMEWETQADIDFQERWRAKR